MSVMCALRDAINNGEVIYVNPNAVQFVRNNVTGAPEATSIVCFQGAQVTVRGTPKDVIKALEKAQLEHKPDQG